MRLILLSLAIFISSCNSSNEEIEQLRKENQALSTEVRELKEEISSLDFSVVVISEKSSIKKGEVFRAIAVMAIEGNPIPISAQLLDIENPTEATFRDDSAIAESKTPGQILITSSPEISGSYNIVGALNLNYLGRKFERLFSIDYEVKE